jgi:Uma2 family endonuclease
MSTTQVEPNLLSADEFWRLPDDGNLTELVRGRIVMMSRPGFRHGWLCNRIGCLLGEFVNAQQLGYVVNNDSGVVTEQDPDTVRGPDIAYYSHQRMPKEQGPPEGYPEVAPELVIEVLSPNDRSSEVLKRIGEYLTVGVLIVCVVDSRRRHVRVFYPDQPDITLGEDDDLTLPQLLPEWRAKVRDLLGG